MKKSRSIFFAPRPGITQAEEKTPPMHAPPSEDGLPTDAVLRKAAKLCVAADAVVFDGHPVTGFGLVQPCERHYPDAKTTVVPTYHFFNKPHERTEVKECKRIEGFMPLVKAKEYKA